MVAVAITIGAITVTAIASSGSNNRRSLSVQVKADLNQAVSDLAALGFRSTRSINSVPSPSYGTDCAVDATHGVRQFLSRHPCKEYATAKLTARRDGRTGQIAMTWVVMPSTALASRYKADADTPNAGNPPGQSPAFNGLCYASGQRGPIVWTEQVQPTGGLSVDRKILQAVAPTKLTPGYLQQHCIR